MKHALIFTAIVALGSTQKVAHPRCGAEEWQYGYDVSYQPCEPDGALYPKTPDWAHRSHPRSEMHDQGLVFERDETTAGDDAALLRKAESYVNEDRLTRAAFDRAERHHPDSHGACSYAAMRAGHSHDHVDCCNDDSDGTYLSTAVPDAVFGAVESHKCAVWHCVVQTDSTRVYERGRCSEGAGWCCGGVGAGGMVAVMKETGGLL